MPRSIARRKTKKAVTKRFKVTGTGKVLRTRAGRRHLAGSKNAKRKMRLGKKALVHSSMHGKLMDTIPFH